ncbi:Retrovirus-related Pol polyprotein from transposon RE1 (Retro element 1) (AtRE1) [Includes: Protease RE1 [Durusdinium trenchii]|uniref:Retrovirus-related Pol polyprotein from transposon RE1 (Retro element 1) (AtRE1) n=1 Tax=Durusdinium trenchii TaxID=1381693 RepID=A0ABP0MCU8_9DINO
MISIRAVQGWNLRVLQPIDIRYGINLRRRIMRRWLLQKLRQWNPRLAIVEMPCTPWSILQRNVNYRDYPFELDQLQEEDRPFVRLVKQVFDSQRSRGGHALVENPATADSWQEPEFQELRQKYWETTSCMCRFGMVGQHGLPLLKRVRWMATDETFVYYLNKQCTGDRQHEKVEGKNTALSACYPPDVGDTIIKAYLEVVQREDFGTHYDWQVMETRHVNYVDVNRTVEEWRPLLAQAEEILARRVQASCFLDITSDLYQKVIPLVPWQILNIQIAHLPKAKRVRPGLENTHRCSVLLLNDNEVLIETEHLPTAQAPRERFITPVRVAIFIHGHAPGEPHEPVPARVQPEPPPLREGEVVEDPLDEHVEQGMAEQGLVRQDYASGECWFIGPPLRHEQRRLAPSLVRMHRNLGHPRTEDFVRALAQHGKIDPEAVALARRLRCASCERTKRPLPPRPTSLKAVGSFNDKVCLDVVFLHDVDEVKHTYLHVLDPAGGFYVFCWIPSRNPEDVLDNFNKVWASWAGLPRSIWADQDGAFQGAFAQTLQAHGVELDYVPAEAHWQAGEVEAYNRAFRYTANKIIDEKQLAGDSSMQLLGTLVGSAMNDKVRACGASASQWVFGRNPRVPEALLGPDGQLEVLQGMEQDEQLRLVKKKKGKILQPGWFRGTIVGPHKGDEAQSNYWVASDGKLILVSKEQLRPTYGTERWKIDEEALQNLLDDFPDEFHNGRDGEPPDEVVPDENEEIHVPVFEADADDLGVEEYTPSLPPEGDGQRPDELPAHENSSPSAPSVGTNTTHPHPSMREDRAPGTPIHGLLRRPEPLPEAIPIDDPHFDEEMALPPPEVAEPVEKKARLEEPDEPEDNRYPANERLPVYDTELYSEPRGALWGVRMRLQVKGNDAVRWVAQTRKQQKALEKEIPWRLIPEEERQGYADALQKEWDTWTKYQAVEVISLEASKYVEDHTDPARILDSRICASHDGWFLFNSDITGAFLQGDQSLASRKEPLYLRQPREGLPGLLPGQLLLVVRGIFGLANSPRLFWRRLRDTLLTMGFVQSRLDRAVFTYYRRGRLILVLGAHVDDLIVTGKPTEADAILEELKKTFDFGSWADSRQDEVLEYGGKQITKENGIVKLTQKKFIQASSTTKIPKWRASTPNAPLLPQEHTELRSLGGCLHWLVGQTRPDLAAATSLYMSGQPTVSNLIQLNKLVIEAQSTADWGLMFRPIPMEQAKFIAFSDSSWANAAELKSQAGLLVFLAGSGVDSLEGDFASLLDWRSHRIRRQCLSTLASETMAMDVGGVCA